MNTLLFGTISLAAILAAGAPVVGELGSTGPWRSSGSEPPESENAGSPAPNASRPSGSVKGTVSIEGGWSIEGHDLARAVVYLASHPDLDGVPADATTATVGQRNKAFIPSFLAVPLGTTIEFPNWDDFDHNVFSRSKAAPAFDLDRYPKGQSKSRVFEKVGVVQVFCNIHPQMRAIIVVTPNRFLARADEKGGFSIEGVPPGRYELVAWHERCGEHRQPVEVGGGEPAVAAITLKETRKNVIESRAPRHGNYGIERGLGVKREKLDLPVVEESHPAPEPEPPK